MDKKSDNQLHEKREEKKNQSRPNTELFNLRDPQEIEDNNLSQYELDQTLETNQRRSPGRLKSEEDFKLDTIRSDGHDEPPSETDVEK